jgi:ABC-type uncharacterized transport system YnjBCD permease subunit
MELLVLIFNLLKPEVSLRTTRINIQKCYMVLALGWVFAVFATAVYVINWLVFITLVDWFLIQSRLRLVFKRLR